MLHHSSSVHLLTRDLISPGFSGNKFNFSGSDNQRVSHKKSFPALHLNVKPFLNKVEDCPAQYFPDNKTPFFSRPLVNYKTYSRREPFSELSVSFQSRPSCSKDNLPQQSVSASVCFVPSEERRNRDIEWMWFVRLFVFTAFRNELVYRENQWKKYYMLLKLNLKELKIADKKKAQPLVKICLSNDLLHLKTIFLLHS